MCHKNGNEEAVNEAQVEASTSKKTEIVCQAQRTFTIAQAKVEIGRSSYSCAHSPMQQMSLILC